MIRVVFAVLLASVLVAANHDPHQGIGNGNLVSRVAGIEDFLDFPLQGEAFNSLVIRRLAIAAPGNNLNRTVRASLDNAGLSTSIDGDVARQCWCS